jgi:hypothetical protein
MKKINYGFYRYTLKFLILLQHTIFCSDKYQYSILTISNPIFLPHAYSPALIYFGRERGWRVTCNYPTILKEKIETERVQPALSVG